MKGDTYLIRVYIHTIHLYVSMYICSYCCVCLCVWFIFWACHHRINARAAIKRRVTHTSALSRTFKTNTWACLVNFSLSRLRERIDGVDKLACASKGSIESTETDIKTVRLKQSQPNSVK